MKSKQMRSLTLRVLFLLLLPILAAGVFWLAAAAYQRWLMPHVPACPIRSSTGFLCPSCGLTHAVIALMHGDLYGALQANAIVFAFPVLAVWWYAEQWVRVFRGDKKIIPRSGKFWLAVLGIWMLYAILRNVMR